MQRSLEERLAQGLRHALLPADAALRGRMLDALLVDGRPGRPVGRPDDDREVDLAATPGRIAHAGLVLAGPFLPRLFDRLELTRDGEFVDLRAMERGVQALSALVTGDAQHRGDRRLARILCAVPDGARLTDERLLSEAELEAIDGLAAALISNWGALGNTSITGLRESFLDRHGVLDDEEDGWRLRVETRAYDVLLDRLPWGISVLRFRWMAKPVFVTWR